jgi:hypothetical protein
MRRIGGIHWGAFGALTAGRESPLRSRSTCGAGRGRPGRKVAAHAEPAQQGGTFDLPLADPTVLGARLTIIDRDDPLGNDVAYPLPVQGSPRGWKALGTRGYRYRGAGSGDDPCTTVLIRKRLVKAVCRGAGDARESGVRRLDVALVIGATATATAPASAAPRRATTESSGAGRAGAGRVLGGAVPPTEMRFGALRRAASAGRSPPARGRWT